MSNLVSAARDGQLAVAMKPEDFVYIDRDCEYFKRTIQHIQTIADEVSNQPNWGLGETNKQMVSAGTVVDRFKGKAKKATDGNDVYTVMEQHYLIVEDIQTTFRSVRERMMQADSNFASEFTRLNETLPERAPIQLPAGLRPDGTGR
ncbi:hypothetical protein [Nocardia colli]|uniref:hypothetical protein n=1 Tax=Nocardia colli TaxID=2545717 RepID=UPI0035DEC6C2